MKLKEFSSIYLLTLLITFVFAVSQAFAYDPNVAETFYVDAVNGNDANLGTSPAQAWKTIDRGDYTGVIEAGDTVIVKSGTYNITFAAYDNKQFKLTVPGITYIADTSGGPVIVNKGSDSGSGFLIDSTSDIVIDGFWLKGADFPLHIRGCSNIEIRNCRISDGNTSMWNPAAYIFNSNGIYFHNNIVEAGTRSGQGILAHYGSGSPDRYYNNIIIGSYLWGFCAHSKGNTVEFKNNIITGAQKDGVHALYNNGFFDCETNLFHNVANLYGGHARKGLGDIVADPMFVNPAAGNYTLQASSPAIDNGTYVGLAFKGRNPDIGAYEYYDPNLAKTYYVKPDGNDAANGLTPETAWASIHNGDLLNILQPGDTVLVLPGTYNLYDSNPGSIYGYGAIFENCSGTTTAPITYKAVGLVEINYAGADEADFAFKVSGLENVVFDGFRFIGGWGCFNTYDTLNLEIKNCRMVGRGAGVWNWRAVGAKVHHNIIGAFYCIQDLPIWLGHDNEYNNNTLFDPSFSKNGYGVLVMNNWYYEVGGNITVKNNIFVRLAYGVYTNDNPDKILRSNNTYDDCEYALYLMDAPTPGGQSTLVYSGAPNGPQENTDPPLIGNDYELLWNSPMIDSGVNVGYQFYGVAPDRGAKEFRGTRTPRTFYVKPNGNDNADGLSIDTAWATIDNGDKKGFLNPGDTIVITEGTYPVEVSGWWNGAINLTKWGSPNIPITYVANGLVNINVVETDPNSVNAVFYIKGGYNVIDGVRTSGAWGSFVAEWPSEGVEIRNTRCSPAYSAIYANNANGIKFHHNIINSGTQAIQSACYWAGGSNSFDNNTIAWAPFGMDIWSAAGTGVTVSVRNNIFVGHYGYALKIQDLAPDNITLSNNTYNWCPVAQIINGFTYNDPSGPQENTINAMIGSDYNLLFGSPCIDTGIDIGYPFSGTAPDRGAREYEGSYPVPTAHVGDVKKLPLLNPVDLTKAVVTASTGQLLDNVIYVEDENRSSGIRVKNHILQANVGIGERISIKGELVSESTGEKMILATQINSIETGEPLAPLSMPGKSVGGFGLDTVGLLVTVWGNVKYVEPELQTYFTIDDGSGKSDGTNPGLPIWLWDTFDYIAAPTQGYVAVTGIVSLHDFGQGPVPVVIPRTSEDVQIIF